MEDYHIKTILDSNYVNAKLEVNLEIDLQADADISLCLRDPAENNRIVCHSLFSPDSKQGKVSHALDISNPRKWTAETPHLYDLEISVAQRGSKDHLQTIHNRVGFRMVEIKGGLLTVNGTPLLLQGVNRHDHHARFGRAVPLSFIRDDLLLMKKNGINALRTSHYPPDPRMLDLCDEVGLWTMDEAVCILTGQCLFNLLSGHDQLTLLRILNAMVHLIFFSDDTVSSNVFLGFYDAIARPLDIPEEMDYEERKKLVFSKAAAYTSDNPAWKPQYVDRMAAVVHRDKNHPSVIIWSLGNEAFYGQNHAAMYEYARAVDPTRPVHYEGDAKAETADMFSYM